MLPVVYGLIQVFNYHFIVEEYYTRRSENDINLIRLTSDIAKTIKNGHLIYNCENIFYPSGWHQILQKLSRMVILYIIAKNIFYLHWNRGDWSSFHNTHQSFLALCIRCTNHLCDSCHLIDVNPHFTAPGCRYYFKTRQHSTQSVRNMPPPSPRHLLPHVLQIMPRNANYDQFQPKGHHNEENSQSMTKMPENPKFYLFH